MSEPIGAVGAAIMFAIVFGIPALFFVLAWQAFMVPPRSLREAVESGVDKAIENFRPQLAKMIADQIAADPVFRFVKHIQIRLHEACPTMPGEESWERAAGVLRQFLKDERAKFGDPRFSWERDGARELAEQYEIECW